MVATYHRIEVSQHPFFVELGKGPVDLGAVYLLMANLQVGISPNFVPWLARTIERVEDRRIGSLLAKQLDDELGRGDFSQIHTRLLDTFVAALGPWRPKGADDALLRAGRRLATDGSRPFHAADPYEGVGALIVGEIFAEKMDARLGAEMRRQHEVSGQALYWLELHEKLEVDHSDDSSELARLVPHEGPRLAAAWRGAVDQWDTLWRFLDDVQELAAGRERPEGSA
ncbi:MAG TPA: iron-containing redox enzyme family protein [Polyangia bacterium]